MFIKVLIAWIPHVEKNKTTREHTHTLYHTLILVAQNTAFKLNLFLTGFCAFLSCTCKDTHMWWVIPSNMTPQPTVMCSYSFTSTRIITSNVSSTIWNAWTFKRVKLYWSVWNLLCAPAFSSRLHKVLRWVNNGGKVEGVFTELKLIDGERRFMQLLISRRQRIVRSVLSCILC